MLAVLFTVSGAVSLVYQLVWARWAGLVLGHFAPAVATVAATFMAGLAIGNLLFGAVASRLSPGRALRLYAVLEGVLALLAAASLVAFSGAGVLYPALVASSPDTLVRAGWCAVLLLPPTILMGASLPAVVQAAGALSPGPLARLYALNTAGAAAGPVLAAFVLMPVLGIQRTLWLACGLNALVAVAAWGLSARAGNAAPAVRGVPEPGSPPASRWPFVLAACSGFLALGFEVALTRLVTLTITLTSVYGFAVVLSAFLLGLAAGAWWLSRRPPAPPGALVAFAAAQAVAWAWVVLAAAIGWDNLVLAMLGVWERPAGFGHRMFLDAAVTALVILPLPAAFGYALPALSACLGRADSGRIGRLFAANTGGAIGGALLTGFVFLPALGLTRTLLGLGTLSLLLAGAAVWAARPRARVFVPFALAALLAAGAVVPEPDPVTMNAGLALRPRRGILDEARAGLAAVVFEEDGFSGRVSVLAQGPGGLIFSIDGAPNASTSPGDLLTQMALAYLPCLTAAHPRRALVIGLGAGITAGSLSMEAAVEEVHVVEIEPAQARVADIFKAFNHDVLGRLSVRLHYDDGRHFLLAGRDVFDVISSDPADLFVSGMANLYTLEFYRLVRARLAPGGAFIQWAHAYHLGSGDLRGLLRTQLEVFPNTSLWVQRHGDLFLLATDAPLRIDLDAWERRLREPGTALDLGRAGLTPGSDLVGLFLWDTADLARYARGARLCTDADPFLEFTTPRIPFSRGDQNRLGLEVTLFGPLEPAPLVRETVEARARLARLAFGHGFLARARAECLRGLALAPGRRDLAARLAEIDAAERAGRARSLSPR